MTAMDWNVTLIMASVQKSVPRPSVVKTIYATIRSFVLCMPLSLLWEYVAFIAVDWSVRKLSLTARNPANMLNVVLIGHVTMLVYVVLEMDGMTMAMVVYVVCHRLTMGRVNWTAMQ